MTLLQLSWTFFYIGLFTIGGGQVAITLMYQPIVESGLLSAEQFYNMVAVSESTPGPIGINMATYVGCELYGVFGGIAATAATVLPSLIIIMIIAKYFNRYHDTPLVKTVFSCIRPVSSGLIAVAAWQVFRISVIELAAVQGTGGWLESAINGLDVSRLLFFCAALFLLIRTKMPPLALIVLGGIFGMIFL